MRKIDRRKCLGALIQSDHMDLMSIPMEKDSFFETSKNVYGKDHRIIVYHSSKLEKKNISFMKRFRKVCVKAREIIESGDSDAMDKARLYLEIENLNATILLPPLTIDRNRMHDHLSVMSKNVLFTNITEMKPEELIDLYRKMNRMEHCFRTISMNDIASPIYHWTPQKIRVHMFFSYLVYMFLSFIYNMVKEVHPQVSLASVQDLLSCVRLQYIISGNDVKKKLDSRDPDALGIAERLGLKSVA